MNFQKITIIIFFGIILSFSTLTVLWKKKDYSEAENKYLSKVPSISAENILNKKFMIDIEKYFSDHFIMRDDFIELKNNLEIFTGKTTINNVRYINDRLLQVVPSVNEKFIKNSIDTINEFKKKHGKKTYISIIPTSEYIYRKKFPIDPGIIDQKQYIDKFYSDIDNDIEKINTVDLLDSKNKEYIYYKTDHHMTILGSYYVYKEMEKVLGFEGIDLKKFKKERVSDDFYGSLHSKLNINSLDKDLVELLKGSIPDENIHVRKISADVVQNFNSIYFKDMLKKKDKYGVFLGLNEPIVDINTGIRNGKKLLIFKDSYANSIATLLYNHYEKITLVDMRLLNEPFEKYLNLDQYTQVLFLYNFYNFVTQNDIQKILIK